MAQHVRSDEPGAWLHAMNRGVARGTAFETRADHRCFLGCMSLADVVRTQWPRTNQSDVLGLGT